MILNDIDIFFKYKQIWTTKLFVYLNATSLIKNEVYKITIYVVMKHFIEI
jgi:hypothetical protein